MKTYRIPFMDQFECLKGDCPVTCCHGWQIPIDPKTYQKHKDTGGFFGVKLFLARGKVDDLPVLNKSASDCAFFTQEGLCRLQLSHGKDFMPGICRRFPRRYKNYGYLCEESLELACPASARLFIEALQANRILYEETEAEPEYPDTSENDDETYLLSLIKCRQELIHYFMEEPNLFQALAKLQKYGNKLQLHCAMTGLSTATPDLSAVSLSMITLSPKEELRFNRYLYDAKQTDLIMCSGVYHTNLKKRLPLFYELCTYYFNTFDSLTAEEADQRLEALFINFLSGDSSRSELLKNYFIYYLQGNFLFAYEDYSFLKLLSLGAMHVHLLLLFLCLYEEHYHSLSKEECANIIAVYERHMRHNDSILDGLWEVLPKQID